jgi:hypothetical protein
MRTFITVARSGDSWSTVAGPDGDYDKQKAAFLAAEKSVAEIQIWSSDRGIIKRRRPNKIPATPAQPKPSRRNRKP